MKILIKSILSILIVVVQFECMTTNKKINSPRDINGKSYYDGKMFRNIQERYKEQSFFDHLKLILHYTFSPSNWPDYFETSTKKLDTDVIMRGDGIRATWINHATFLLQVDGLNILTDPIYRDFSGPNRVFSYKRVTNPAVQLEDLPKIDIVIISHNHYDHLDLKALKLLYKKQKDRPPVILVGLGNGSLLKKVGLTEFIELGWLENYTFKGIDFYFTEAIHGSGRSLSDENKTLWGAYLIKTPEGNIYFAGDTAYGSQFKDIYSKFGETKLSLLPIGSYKPRWFMKSVHMNPEEAAKAHIDLKSNLSIAMHYATFNAASDAFDEPLNDLEDAKNKFGLADRFIDIKMGETLHIK